MRSLMNTHYAAHTHLQIISSESLNSLFELWSQLPREDVRKPPTLLNDLIQSSASIPDGSDPRGEPHLDINNQSNNSTYSNSNNNNSIDTNTITQNVETNGYRSTTIKTDINGNGNQHIKINNAIADANAHFSDQANSPVIVT